MMEHFTANRYYFTALPLEETRALVDKIDQLIGKGGNETQWGASPWTK